MIDYKGFFKEKNILVTGGVGSIGREIVKSLLNFAPKVIRVLDINETGLFELEEELDSKNIRPFIGDIRDKDRLKKAIEGVDIVFHAAALKHVPLCEYNPFEGAKTNVNGTQNLLDVSLNEEVEKFITISTDKVVNPVNVMGATKLLAERLTTSANLYKGNRKSAFSVVRFGNVLNSRGSILPIIKRQIEKGGPVTLTDSKMSRFVMSIEEATKLVLKAAIEAEGGEIFILKMPALKIKDLIEVVIEELSAKYGYSPDEISIENIGIRPGEKLFEELMTEEEAYNAKDLGDMFVIYPEKPYREKVDGALTFKYVSDEMKFLKKDAIRNLLKNIEYY
jgi:UDP-N-acetylglucosamine 4,6-dehydratase